MGALFFGEFDQHFQRSIVGVDFAFGSEPHQNCFVGSPDARVGRFEPHQEPESLRCKMKVGEFEGRAVDLADDQNAWPFHEQFLNRVVLNSGRFCKRRRGQSAAQKREHRDDQRAGTENV